MENGFNNIGARRAAIRRTKFELGFELDLHDLTCGARILYSADCDEEFTEYELDYIVFSKKSLGQLDSINENEVINTEWVSLRDLSEFMEEKQHEGEDFTPWFKLIQGSGMLERWWQQLETKGSLPDEAGKIVSFI